MTFSHISEIATKEKILLISIWESLKFEEQETQLWET
jgi:hypothetical protein